MKWSEIEKNCRYAVKSQYTGRCVHLRFDIGMCDRPELTWRKEKK